MIKVRYLSVCIQGTFPGLKLPLSLSQVVLKKKNDKLIASSVEIHILFFLNLSFPFRVLREPIHTFCSKHVSPFNGREDDVCLFLPQWNESLIESLLIYQTVRQWFYLFLGM
jgi:hypothetical protein